MDNRAWARERRGSNEAGRIKWMLVCMYVCLCALFDMHIGDIYVSDVCMRVYANRCAGSAAGCKRTCAGCALANT